MRTKTLLLAAALTAAGIASSLAQSNVYSLNVVGYVNTVCAPGYNLINNPLVRTDNNNSITNLLDAYVPGGNSVLTFVGGGFQTYVKDEFDNTWNGPGTQLPNGTGFFLRNVGANPLTVTFVGEVPQGTVVNTPAAGYSLLGSKVPQAAQLEDLGVVPGPGDSVLRFAGGNFLTYVNDEFDNTWSPVGPNDSAAKGPFIKVGEGLFYRNSSGTATWTRVFNVGP